jgi:ABC-type transport system substrate-binding protein
MKNIGIGADNYKLEKFKKELEAAGYTDYDITPFSPGVSFIQIHIPDEKYNKETINSVKVLCQQVELHFHHSN